MGTKGSIPVTDRAKSRSTFLAEKNKPTFGF